MNAASSVLGSVLAMVIAIQFGLNVTLTCGAVAYLLALTLSKTVSPRLPDVETAPAVCYDARKFAAHQSPVEMPCEHGAGENACLARSS